MVFLIILFYGRADSETTFVKPICPNVVENIQNVVARNNFSNNYIIFLGF